MKKFYSFIIAAMAAVTMCAETIQQDIALTPGDGDWGWGYNCSVTAVEGGLQAQLTGDWGALSTGWNPEIDLSGWDKIIILVDRMDGCAGEWFQLKAYLRDHADNEGCQMEGLLGNDADGSHSTSSSTSNRRKPALISQKRASWLSSVNRMVPSSLSAAFIWRKKKRLPPSSKLPSATTVSVTTSSDNP